MKAVSRLRRGMFYYEKQVSFGHNCTNLSDYSFLFLGVIKYHCYFVNVPQQGKGILGSLHQSQEQKDHCHNEAVPVLVRISAENDCPLFTNSTLTKGQKAEQPPPAYPREREARSFVNVTTNSILLPLML